VTIAGVSEERTGTGFAIVNTIADDVPPPGVGFTTVICAVPALAMSLAGIAAVSWELLTYVVFRDAPFQLTVDPVTKPMPLAVSVNPAAPAAAVVGDTEAREGAGFFDRSLPSPSQPATRLRVEARNSRKS
jgi:hypothetical protein